MIGSLYSAVSGLSSHQTKMSVIGNNIANINTYGFKSSRVTFTDVFYQTLATATSSSTSSGGTNPTQLGFGSQIKSIDVMNTRAGSTSTDRALDVYINGDGYLAVKGDDGQTKYTRVGILSFDSTGNLVDSNGSKVMGLPVNSTTGLVSLNSDGTTATSNLVAITVDPAYYATLSDIAIGEDGAITATAEGDPKVTLSGGTSWISSADISASSNYTGDIKLTTTTTATGFTAATANTSFALNTADIVGDVTIKNTGGVYTLSYTDAAGNSVSKTGVLNGADYDFTVDTLAGGTTTFTVDSLDLPASGASATVGTFNATAKTITGTTYDQSGASVALSGTWTTGGTTVALGDITLNVTPATMAASSDATDATVGGIGAGDGEIVTLGYLAMVKFANVDGLSQDGDGYFVKTVNSGDAVATIAGNGGTGSLISGALESSNVDLSSELTEMIVTQRGFQANSKMITVSDEMLETLVNMKR